MTPQPIWFQSFDFSANSGTVFEEGKSYTAYEPAFFQLNPSLDATRQFGPGKLVLPGDTVRVQKFYDGLDSFGSSVEVAIVEVAGCPIDFTVDKAVLGRFLE